MNKSPDRDRAVVDALLQVTTDMRERPLHFASDYMANISLLYMMHMEGIINDVMFKKISDGFKRVPGLHENFMAIAKEGLKNDTGNENARRPAGGVGGETGERTDGETD